MGPRILNSCIKQSFSIIIIIINIIIYLATFSPLFFFIVFRMSGPPVHTKIRKAVLKSPVWKKWENRKRCLQ